MEVRPSSDPKVRSMPSQHRSNRGTHSGLSSTSSSPCPRDVYFSPSVLPSLRDCVVLEKFPTRKNCTHVCTRLYVGAEAGAPDFTALKDFLQVNLIYATRKRLSPVSPLVCPGLSPEQNGAVYTCGDAFLSPMRFAAHPFCTLSHSPAIRWLVISASPRRGARSLSEAVVTPVSDSLRETEQVCTLWFTPPIR